VLSCLDRLWRVGGTGVAFVSFGLGGGILAVTVFPLVALFAPATEDAHRRVRRVIHWLFRAFVRCVEGMGVIRVIVEGAGRLSDCRGCLIVANHPTLLDVVLLMSLTPRLQCVVKHQLWRNVFLRGVVSAAGFIRNDLPADDILERCAAAFARGDNLLIFPEGTRTVPGTFPAFHRGVANIAILSRADLQLVVITCDPITLTRGEPWYSVPRSRPRFLIRIDERWSWAKYRKTPHRGLNARRLVRSLEAFYQDALSDGRTGA
jgi:1-acyl-sn-glycerol-3-phosphate acyltransferase